MKRNQINSSHLSFVCPMKCSDFEQSDGEYFCNKCQKTVFDLTECSLDEVIALQRKKGSICGVVRAIGATSLLSLSSCAGTVCPPDQLTDQAVIGTIPISGIENEAGSEQDDDANQIPR